MVSLIVPAWNAGAGIEAALESALGDPAAPPLECLVIDDGSADDTAEVVSAVAARDPRVRLIRAPANEGVSAARNRGLAAARGEWLAFLDADDRLRPGAVRDLLAAATATDALAVVGQRTWTDGRRHWLGATYDIPDIRRPGPASLVERPGLVYYASATGKLFHRSLAQGLVFEGRVLGDQPWTLRALIRAGTRIEVIGEVVYDWVRPAGPSSATITAAKRGSARLAAEAARVAIRAVAEVDAEAAERLVPADRERVVAAYVERIVRADLAGPLVRAIATVDEHADELLGAIEAFLAAAPAGSVDRSAAVATWILRPPVERWLGLRGTARLAAWRLITETVRDHPRLAGLVGPGVARFGLSIARRWQGAPARRVAGALFVLDWPFGLVHRWRRRDARRDRPISRPAVRS